MNSDEILKAIMAQLGGPEGLARKVKEHLDATRPGSMARFRTLAIIAGMVESQAERKKDSP